MISIVRSRCPLVHCITNYVTVNDTANAILAVGASPIMSDDINDVEDIVSISQALVINIGTLNERTVRSMVQAGMKANELGIPVVLDPVGAGASSYRNRTVDELLSKVSFTVIRGNLSEMAYINGSASRTKGVDSSMSEADADPVAVASSVSCKTGAVAAITGRVDTVAKDGRIARIYSGHPEMGRITGTGCMLSGIIGSFVGTGEDPFLMTANAIAAMGAAGIDAYEKAGHLGTGSFRVAIIDALSLMSDAMIKEKIATVRQKGFDIRYLIMGGSPTFPCYAPYEDVYCSPGTIFINDAGYSASYADLDFPPAAAILTRVISNPAPGAFTLDLGYKGIASDPAGSRGVIVGLDNVEQQFQSEEHWAWRMKSGHEDECPVVGDELFVIPTHICPTSALYPYAIVIEDGRIVDRYETTARNRKITF